MKTLILCILLSESICWSAEHVCIHGIVVPEYPSLARMAQIQGTVNPDVRIGPDGKVLSVKASGGHALLMQAARKSVLDWSFEVPAVIKQFPIPYTLAIVYKIEGAKTSSFPCRPPDRVEILTQPPEIETTTTDQH